MFLNIYFDLFSSIIFIYFQCVLRMQNIYLLLGIQTHNINHTAVRNIRMGSVLSLSISIYISRSFLLFPVTKFHNQNFVLATISGSRPSWS